MRKLSFRCPASQSDVWLSMFEVPYHVFKLESSVHFAISSLHVMNSEVSLIQENYLPASCGQVANTGHCKLSFASC
jgi:hypothetical protein